MLFHPKQKHLRNLRLDALTLVSQKHIEINKVGRYSNLKVRTAAPGRGPGGDQAPGGGRVDSRPVLVTGTCAVIEIHRAEH